jgi:hypothetical protein
LRWMAWPSTTQSIASPRRASARQERTCDAALMVSLASPSRIARLAGTGWGGGVLPPELLPVGPGDLRPADAADGAFQAGKQAPAWRVVGPQGSDPSGGRHGAQPPEVPGRPDPDLQEQSNRVRPDVRQLGQTVLGVGCHGALFDPFDRVEPIATGSKASRLSREPHSRGRELPRLRTNGEADANAPVTSTPAVLG